LFFPGNVSDTFSPYLDPEPWAEWWDDFARRNMLAIVTTLFIHIILFLMLQPSFVVPDLIEDEPEAIPVQIIAFEDAQPEPAPPPEPIELRPAIPALAPPPPPPSIKPKPKPAPPPPPPPDPKPEPDAVVIPPPPEILTQESQAPEPDDIVIPEPLPIPPPPEPVTLPEVQPEPDVVPQPTVEIFEPVPQPLPPEPLLPDPLPPEPLPPEPLPPEPQVEIFEPLPVPDPLPPVSEPEIITEPIRPLEPVLEPDPILEPEPFVTPDAIETQPTPGPVIEEALPDLPQIEELPALPAPEPIPEPVPETPPAPTIEPIEPELIPEDEAPIITTAPTILASPEAPTTSEEAEKAIPQEQAAPIGNDFLFKKPGGQRGVQQPATGLGTPGTGQPSPSAPTRGSPFGGATRRTSPGSGGWTLAPGTGGTDLGEGYKGLVLDIRCREAGRTHADCPEYLRKYSGRNASGFETFSTHAPSGTSSSSGTRPGRTYGSPVIGGAADPWSSSIGDNSINGGGPSTTVLDDADFGREFLGTDLNRGTSGGRVRDIFKDPEEPWENKPILLPPPEQKDGE